MKLHKLLGLLAISSMVLGACGDDSSQEDADVEENQSQVESADENEAESEEQEAEVEEEAEEESSKEIVLGETIELDDYSMTIQNYSLGTDYEGANVLIIDYDWVNNSDEATSPFMTFLFKGYQDSVETSDVFMVDGVDLESGQKDVKPGGKVEGAQATVGIDDLEKPLELELDVLFSFVDDAYTTTLDLSTIE